MDTVTVITRSGKGNPLTSTEMDHNLTALAGAINTLSTETTANIETAVADLTAALEAIQAQVSTLSSTLESGISRATVAVKTASLAAASTTYLEVPMGKAYHILTIGADYPARVRVYETAAHRAADVSRAVGTFPVNDHGLVAEAILAAGTMTATFAPCPFGANLDAAVTSTAYLSITNRDVVAREISITFDRLLLES